MSRIQYANGRIPCIESLSAVITSNVLVVTFPPYRGIPKNFSGLIAVRIPQTVGDSTFGKTQFVIQDKVKELTTPTGSVGSSIFPTGSVVTVIYDRGLDKLEFVQ